MELSCQFLDTILPKTGKIRELPFYFCGRAPPHLCLLNIWRRFENCTFNGTPHALQIPIIITAAVASTLEAMLEDILTWRVLEEARSPGWKDWHAEHMVIYGDVNH
eukprot:2789084-Amphidinium_carterae.1